MAQKKPIKPALKKANSRQPIANSQAKRDYTIILLWVMIVVVSAIRYRLITVPFERDEGEYGYIGNLFLHGVAPFKDAYSMKLPGTSFMYSILMLIFGHTNTGVHTGVVFINAATMYFLYTAFKKIFNPFIGLATATIYGFMAIGLVFDGFAAHATHFICFYSSIALFFLADYLKSGKPLKVFLCGLMFGMAFLMKQQAVFLILFGGLILLIHLKTEKKQSFVEIVKNLPPFAAGVFIPYIIVLLIIAASGEFSVFWLWTVKYASTYESVKDMQMIIALFNSTFVAAWYVFYHLWLLALAGLIVLYLSPFTRFQKVFAALYVLASVLVVSSGFYFRQHYFIALLPAMGLLIGIFIEYVTKLAKALKSQYVPVVALAVVVLFTIYVNHVYYFEQTSAAVCDNAYWGNPFNQAKDIAKYIKDRTKDTDKVAILGSEPE
ncbi:MAG TPA: glycosyltransferase family 39 protein, partial [Bacteroidia bacterium]|nr:glycosyltransferase family 39 protein [Bacteroidia bacterium]